MYDDKRTAPEATDAAQSLATAKPLDLLDSTAWVEIVANLRAQMNWSPAPPEVPCPWCGAEPGAACRIITPMRRRRAAPRVRSTPNGCHYSRGAS